jgi:hypothetical protein
MGVFVLPTSCDSVAQPDCDTDDAVFYHPTVVYFYSSGTRLQPGACRVWQVSWPIATWGEQPLDGTYKVFGGMFKPDWTVSPPGAFVVPRGGALLTIQINSSVPVEEGSWGRIKGLYGQPNRGLR